MNQTIYYPIEDGSLNAVYPVGAYYTSTDPTSPGQLFGGTWQSVEDTMLFAGSADQEEGDYIVGATGGESTHQLTIQELPSHDSTSAVQVLVANTGTAGSGILYATYVTKQRPTANGSNYNAWYSLSASVGGNGAHNNMPPIYTVYCWERIA